jgi:alpha-galactosidase
MQAANAMVDLGFKDAGYEYVVLDDCWSEMKGRDPVTSRLVPNTTKFPDGMSGTADKVHALGLKYGMYSSAGTMTCGRYPGSLGYEAIDAATFAEWGVDYLKVSGDFVILKSKFVLIPFTVRQLLPSGDLDRRLLRLQRRPEL